MRDIIASKFNTYQAEETRIAIILNITVASVIYCMGFFLYHSFETSAPENNNNLTRLKTSEHQFIKTGKCWGQQQVSHSHLFLPTRNVKEVMNIRAGLLDM